MLSDEPAPQTCLALAGILITHRAKLAFAVPAQPVRTEQSWKFVIDGSNGPPVLNRSVFRCIDRRRAPRSSAAASTVPRLVIRKTRNSRWCLGSSHRPRFQMKTDLALQQNCAPRYDPECFHHRSDFGGCLRGRTTSARAARALKATEVNKWPDTFLLRWCLASHPAGVSLRLRGFGRERFFLVPDLNPEADAPTGRFRAKLNVRCQAGPAAGIGDRQLCKAATTQTHD
jgi:hypothetical protein